MSLLESLVLKDNISVLAGLDGYLTQEGYIKMFSNAKLFASRILRNEEGATLVEYVLLVGLVAIVASVAMTTLGTKASSALNTAANKLP